MRLVTLKINISAVVGLTVGKALVDFLIVSPIGSIETSSVDFPRPCGKGNQRKRKVEHLETNFATPQKASTLTDG